MPGASHNKRGGQLDAFCVALRVAGERVVDSQYFPVARDPVAVGLYPAGGVVRRRLSIKVYVCYGLDEHPVDLRRLVGLR